VTVHAATLGVLALDAVALILLVAAAFSSLRIIAGWAPGSADRRQLDLERRAERGSLELRGAAIAFLMSSVLLIATVASVLPGLTAGAMCGTGVLEAMAGKGDRALWLRALACALLGAWAVLDRLNRRHPLAPITCGAARAQLVASAIVGVSIAQSAAALASLDTTTPVGCCTALYLAATDAAATVDRLPPIALLAIAGLVTALVLVTGIVIALSRETARRSRLGLVFGSLMVLWIGVASTAMVRVGAAYHYEVLSHECPWCLFRAENAYVGYALLAALAVGLFEAMAVVVASGVAQRVPELTARAVRRARRGALGALIAVVVFLALGGGPAIAWRLRFDTWL